MSKSANDIPLDELKTLARLATDFRSKFNELVYDDDGLMAAFNEAVRERGIKEEAVSCAKRIEVAFDTISASTHSGTAYERTTRDWSQATIRLSELYADIADRILPYAEMNEIIPFAARDRSAIHDGFVALGAPSLADFYF